jgi:4-hydroxy-3-methylbut-2-enyl diphosphate reductase
MNENTENFAELLESSFKTLNTGEIVEGVITAITGTEIHVDLGAKTTGVIARDKATDDPQAKLEDLFKVGDTVRAKVVKVSDVDGIATLDKTRVDSESNWDKIVEACESQETLTGRITEAVKGGVIINLNSVRVFIPASLTGIPKDGDLNAIVGTDQKVKIIEIKPERRRAYASIRAVQREERKAREEAFWNNIQEGMEFDGEVKSLTDFGAFVDLGGVDGMVHTSELSWRRIRRPSDVVSVGDKIHVYVKGFDRERGRISLGYKTEEMNPWYIFTQKYQEGDTAEVKIVSLMPFGAFAEIVPGCDGLIHISQIADHKIAKPDEILSVGDIVNAKITQIDNENHKVSLSIRQLLQEAARAAEEAAEAAEEAAEEEPAPEEAPVEEAPVEEAPVEEAPVEEAPVEEAPVEAAPVEEAPAEPEAPADAE